jgi:type I restriction enzyme M protein
LHTKAVDIDAAVYDLKAVNPNVKAMSDTRTVFEIIENINLQGLVTTTAMNNLRGLLAEG